MKDFQFPPSVQSDLWNYLKPEQQKLLRPILRIMKRPCQEKLCVSLLDYLESGQRVPPDDAMLEIIFNQLADRWSPLRVSHEPVHISEIIRQIFPSFSKG